MEVACGVGTLAVAALVYRIARLPVSCWFCNQRNWVSIEQRNSFDCNSCQQYNGFGPDGGYNKIVEAQHRKSPKIRFADPQPVRENVDFCEQCLFTQEKQRRAVAEWEATDEDNWEAELEQFRRRLDRFYPLCDRCVVVVQTQLHHNKMLYSHLSQAGPSFSTVSTRSGRYWPQTEGGIFASLLLLMSLALSLFYVVSIADEVVAEVWNWEFLPLSSRAFALLFISHTGTLSLTILAIHAAFVMTTRKVSVTSLLLFPCLLAVWLLTDSGTTRRESLLVETTAASVLLLLIISLILPCSKKERQRPSRLTASRIGTMFTSFKSPVLLSDGQRSPLQTFSSQREDSGRWRREDTPSTELAGRMSACSLGRRRETTSSNSGPFGPSLDSLLTSRPPSRSPSTAFSSGPFDPSLDVPLTALPPTRSPPSTLSRPVLSPPPSISLPSISSSFLAHSPAQVCDRWVIGICVALTATSVVVACYAVAVARIALSQAKTIHG